MNHEVVVVGGGIGGLTTAALLAARGVKVCLFERQSRVGGCVANFEYPGYAFEPTAGLYSGWETAGVYDQIFSLLRVTPPEIRRLSPAYVVRLPDGAEILIGEETAEFENSLRQAFPECREAAVSFYSGLARVAQSWNDGQDSRSDRERSEFLGSVTSPTALHLADVSPRFRR